MKIVSFSPFERVDSLRNQIDRVFAEIENNNYSSWQPPLELIDEGDNLILRVFLAGINKEDLEIDVTKKSVTIEGKRDRLSSESSNYLYSEINYGRFHREIGLPVPIINTKVTASYEAGILTLVLPKVEEAKYQVVKVNLADSASNTAALPETDSATEEVEL